MSNHKRAKHTFLCEHCKKEVTEIVYKFILNRQNAQKKRFCKKCKKFRHSHWRENNPDYYEDYRLKNYDKLFTQRIRREILKNDLTMGYLNRV